MVRKSTPDKFIINTLSPQFAGLRFWYAAQHPDSTLYELMRGENATWVNSDPAEGWIIDGERGGFVLNHPNSHQSDYYEGTNAPDIDSETDISISAWVKLDSLAATRTYFAKNSLGGSPTSIELKWHSSNGWQVSFNEAGVNSEGHTGTTGYSADTWYHIVVVYDGNGSTDDDKVKVYIDGVDVSIDNPLTFSGTLPLAIPATAGKVYIGATFDASDNPIEVWDGKTDDIRIYGIILAPGNVARMYDLSTRWELYRGPEIGFIGLAAGATTFNETGSGGILVGGEPAETMVFNPTGAGGTLVGGIANVSTSETFNETGSGGILVGGEPAETIIINETVAGGTLVGGEPAETMIFNPSVAGGTLVGGEPAETIIINETVAGGILVGGEATIDSAEAKLPDGGILVGGEPAETTINNPSVAGGTLAGGEALDSEEQIEPVAGGVLVGGIAQESEEQTEPVAGGTLVGGEPAETTINNPSVAGGTLVGGETTVNSAEAKLPDGGILVGGEAIEEIGLLGLGGILVGGEPAETMIFNPTVAGGALVGGEIIVDSTEAKLPDGGVLIGGFGALGFNEIGEGGILVGGIITINSVEAFIPAGGTLVGGLANVTSAETKLSAGGLKAAFNGYSLDFDSGSTDYVDVDGTAFSGPTNISFSVWVKPAGDISSGTFKILAKGGNIGNPRSGWTWQIDIREGGKARASFSPGSDPFPDALGTTVLQVGTWYFLCGTYDEVTGTGKLYVNGIEEASDSQQSGQLNTENGPLVFGRDNNGGIGGSYYEGLIDDVRVYSRTLTPSEVNKLSAGRDISSSNLIGHWEFNKGTGTTAFDAVDASNNGTLNGLPTWSTDVPLAIKVTADVNAIHSPDVQGGGILVGGEPTETMINNPSVAGGTLVGGETTVNSAEAFIPTGGVLAGGEGIEEIGLLGLGGILVGGEPAETIISNPSVEGGTITGGSADEDFSDVIEVGGGILAGGEAIEEIGLLGLGGILVGGEPAETMIFNPSVAGGTLVGGIADITANYTIAVAGGTLVGGEPAETMAFDPFVAGGTLVGGLATVNSAEAKLPAGGVITGGEGIEEISLLGTGGILVGGEPAETMAFNLPVAGGTFVGGEITVDSAEAKLPDGGILVSGEAIEEISLLGTGGILAGGIADINVVYNTSVTGGVLVDGTAPESEEQTEPVDGGVLVGGLATVDSAEAKVPVGGIVIGGTGAAGFTEIGAGGAIVGGIAEVSGTEAFVPTGGVIAGGIADINSAEAFVPAGGTLVGGEVLEEITENVSSGVLVGGIAARSSVEAFIPTGGILVGGEVFEEITENVDGGILVGGIANVISVEAFVPTGGTLVGGEPAETTILNAFPAGGILVGGEVLEEITENVSGGVLAGGIATHSSAEAKLPDGGVLVGGKTIEIFNVSVNGGVLLGGEVIEEITENVSGGVLVGGLADISSVEAFIPVGGTLVSGEALVSKITIGIPLIEIIPIVIPSRGTTPTVKPHTELNENSLQFKGLKYAWPMLHPGGEELYDLARGQDGVLTNMADVSLNWIIDGVRGGYVLNLDGTNDFVNLGDLKQTEEVTVSLWFNSDAVADDEEIYSQTSGLDSQSGGLRFQSGAIQVNDTGIFNEIIPSSVITAGTWHHLVVVYDIAGNATGFLDGQQHSTQTASFEFNGPSFGLGNALQGAGTTFQGSFDDVRLYDRVLVLAEIIHLHNPQTRWELYTESERAIVGVTFANIGQGVVCGGEATLSNTETFIPEGGVLVGGEVLEEITENVDGGVIVGGIVLEAMSFDPLTEGGAIVGGIADVTSIEAFIPAGGIIVGGIAVEEFVPGVEGGVKVGGTVEPPETVSGGVLLGGASNATFFEVGIGGAIVGGEAFAQEIQEELVSGGVIVGGINEAALEFVVKGGVLVGGIADIADTQQETVSGGIIVGGVGNIGRIFTEVASGGVILGGLSPSGFSEVGIGGAIVGGDVNESVIHDFTYTGDGIIIIGGCAGVRRVLRTPSLGTGEIVIPILTGDSCIDCCQNTRDDCPHWSEHWQDKWQEPYDAIKESVDEVEELVGLWENQWQSAWPAAEAAANGETVNA